MRIERHCRAEHCYADAYVLRARRVVFESCYHVRRYFFLSHAVLPPPPSPRGYVYLRPEVRGLMPPAATLFISAAEVLRAPQRERGAQCSTLCCLPFICLLLFLFTSRRGVYPPARRKFRATLRQRRVARQERREHAGIMHSRRCYHAHRHRRPFPRVSSHRRR